MRAKGHLARLAASRLTLCRADPSRNGCLKKQLPAPSVIFPQLRALCLAAVQGITEGNAGHGKQKNSEGHSRRKLRGPRNTGGRAGG